MRGLHWTARRRSVLFLSPAIVLTLAVLPGCSDDSIGSRPDAAIDSGHTEAGGETGAEAGEDVGADAGEEAGADAGGEAGAEAGGDAGGVDMGSGDAPIECTPPTGPGTEHSGNIDADETWTAADGPHVVTFDLHVKSGTLTLEPCVEVRVKEGYIIDVGGGAGAPSAKLLAHGIATRPIRIGSEIDGKYWGGLVGVETGTLDLENVTLAYGGNHGTSPHLGGTLILVGPGGTTQAPTTRVQNVRIEHSAGFGVNIQQASGFTADSSGLTIVDSGREPGMSIDDRYPIFVWPPSIQTLPPGSYTGNALDRILVGNQGIDADETFHDRGIPYQLQGGFATSPKNTEAQGGLATLTIEAGVTIMLLKTPGNVPVINLGTSGGGRPEEIWPTRLIAAGTPTKPIVLTSAASTPAPGDWGGITWAGGPPTGNVMSNVTVDYAGGRLGIAGFGCGPTDNDAALIISNWRPDDAFVQQCTFRNSGGGGIVSGWQSDNSGPNFKSGNTFTAIGNGCAVSRWKNVSMPVCPSDGAMPDCL